MRRKRFSWLPFIRNAQSQIFEIRGKYKYRNSYMTKRHKTNSQINLSSTLPEEVETLVCNFKIYKRTILDSR